MLPGASSAPAVFFLRGWRFRPSSKINTHLHFITYMKNTFQKLLFLALMSLALASCTNDEMVPIYGVEQAGKVVIKSYNGLQDSLQVVADGKPLEILTRDAFLGRIVTEYDFVFYDHKTEKVDIVNKATGEILKTYSFTTGKPIDTISFYANEAIWIDSMTGNKPGVLSAAGRTGYRFILPTMNRYSNSGYEGPVDAIIKKINGQVLGVAENITKEDFSDYIEFAFAPPPIITIELVKHGTTESYVTGQQVVFQMVMQNNKSKLVLLNEKADEGGIFTGVEGNVNVADYFDF